MRYWDVENYDDIVMAWILQILSDLYQHDLHEVFLEQVARELLARHPQYFEYYEHALNSAGLLLSQLNEEGYTSSREETDKERNARAAPRGLKRRYTSLTKKALQEKSGWDKIPNNIKPRYRN